MRTETRQGVPVVLTDEEGAALSTGEDALTLIGETYGGEAETIVVPVGRLDPEFFRLRSGIAGEFVQKFVNYGKRLVILGDVSGSVSASSALQAFVVESNRGNHLWFVPDLDALDAHLRAWAATTDPGADPHVEPTPGPAR